MTIRVPHLATGVAACCVWMIATAAAGATIPCVPGELFKATSSPGMLLIAPDGSGPTLANASCTITVTLRACDGNPVAGVPSNDIWVGDSGFQEIQLCPGGSIADHATDAQGVTTISGPIAGGGHTQSPLLVYVSGIPLQSWALSIAVVSPDINGDLAVNLADVADFSVDYASGSAAFRSDFNHDGRLNLADVGELAAHLGGSCP